MNVVQLIRGTDASSQSEVEIMRRLSRWREHFGNPLGTGRANPDNEMFYLLLDAEDAIRGLRAYARSLEDAMKAVPSRQEPHP